MIKNYILTAYRNLVRNRSFAAINVLGLALGLTCCLIIFLTVRFELSYDAFHQQGKRIYRINTHVIHSGEEHRMPNVPLPLMEAFRNEAPQIEKGTVIHYSYGGLVSIPRDNGAPVRFQEENGVAFVEPEFFEMFSFDWIQGNPRSSLQEPRSVVLTESLALKYFNEQNPVGKTLRLNNQLDLQVRGIVKDFPTNTDFPFTLLISFPTLQETMSEYNFTSWVNLSSSVQSYVLLPEGADIPQLEKQLNGLTRKYMSEEDATKRSYALQALHSIHFSSEYGNYPDRTVPMETIWSLALIGFFLMVTACINFVNLATAQAIKRSKEVGVRKVLGSSRPQLFWQFLIETTLITLAAALLATGATYLALPPVRELLDLPLTFSPLTDPAILIFLTGLTVTVSLLSGFYPAAILSGFPPIQALKSKFSSHTSGELFLRRGLVVLQFSISQVLIIGTIVITNQMDYFQNKSLGFNKEAIISVPVPDNRNLNYETLRSRLIENTGINGVSFASSSISSPNRWLSPISFMDQGVKEEFNVDVKFADEQYLKTNELELLAGRNYLKADTIREVVVNEALIRKMGITDPQDAIGRHVSVWDRHEAPIVGVVKDFHLASFHEDIGPCLIATRANSYRVASIRLSPQRMNDALAHVEQVWASAFPDYLFDYEFLDQTIARYYAEEQKIAGLFNIFSGIAITISCLGLLGLISYITAQRTKEMGVRKVLGASTVQITLLYFKEFASLVLLAFLIAAPLAWFVMNEWLQNFRYAVEVGPGIFILAAGVSLAIAAITVGYQSVQAARSNPIKNLRID